MEKNIKEGNEQLKEDVMKCFKFLKKRFNETNDRIKKKELFDTMKELTEAYVCDDGDKN